jgi:uncharacterized protein (DUF433 family)
MRRETKSSINDYPDALIFRNFRALNANLRGQVGKGRHGVDQLVQIVEKPVNRKVVHEHFCTLAARLCAEHPNISTDAAIFGGMPHIKDVRLSVGDILAQLYTYGSIQEILNIYSPDITEEQIKEAIAYAQDFLETACDPR